MNRKKSDIDMKGISIRDAIYIGGLLLSMGTIYGIIGSRISTLETNLAQTNQRYEREVVPRSEHIQMNAVLEQRLQAIIDSQKLADRQIEQIQTKLDTIIQKH